MFLPATDDWRLEFPLTYWMGKIALFGAAGTIGNSIAPALRANQQPYRVVGRSRDALQRDFGSDSLAEIVTWNPDDPASVIAAAKDIDTIIYLVGVPYDHFELHPQLMRKTLDGAIAAACLVFCWWARSTLTASRKPTL